MNKAQTPMLKGDQRRPTQATDATLHFMRDEAVPVSFLMSGPRQWEELWPQDLCPISFTVELKSQWDNMKKHEIPDMVEGYLRYPVPKFWTTPCSEIEALTHICERRGSVSFDDMLKFMALSSKPKAFTETVYQFCMDVFRVWLLCNGRWMIQKTREAREDRPPSIFLLDPVKDFASTNNLSTLLPPDFTPGCSSIQSFMRKVSASHAIQYACMHKKFKKSVIKTMNQRFGQNAMAALISRGFHPMDTAGLNKKLGLGVEYFSKWRSQMSILVQRSSKRAQGSSKSPVVIMSHMWMSPRWLNVGTSGTTKAGEELTGDQIARILFQLAWFQTKSDRKSILSRMVNLKQGDFTHAALYMALKTRFWDVRPFFAHRLGNTVIRNSFFVMNKGTLVYGAPPVQGIEWLHAPLRLMNLPVDSLFERYCLPLSLMVREVNSGRDVLRPGYTHTSDQAKGLKVESKCVECNTFQIIAKGEGIPTLPVRSVSVPHPNPNHEDLVQFMDSALEAGIPARDVLRTLFNLTGKSMSPAAFTVRIRNLYLRWRKMTIERTVHFANVFPVGETLRVALKPFGPSFTTVTATSEIHDMMEVRGKMDTFELTVTRLKRCPPAVQSRGSKRRRMSDKGTVRAIEVFPEEVREAVEVPPDEAANTFDQFRCALVSLAKHTLRKGSVPTLHPFVKRMHAMFRPVRITLRRGSLTVNEKGLHNFLAALEKVVQNSKVALAQFYSHFTECEGGVRSFKYGGPSASIRTGTWRHLYQTTTKKAIDQVFVSSVLDTVAEKMRGLQAATGVDDIGTRAESKHDTVYEACRTLIKSSDLGKYGETEFV